MDDSAPKVGAITVQLILMGMIRGEKTLMMQERARTITRERDLSMGTGMESSAQVAGVALGRRPDRTSTVTGQKAEYVSTNAGWPGDVAVAVEVLFSMKEEAKSSTEGIRRCWRAEEGGQGIKRRSRKVRE